MTTGDAGPPPLYERDFHAWTMQQAEALRRAGAARLAGEISWDNVAEEIESMGRRDFRALVSHLARVVEQLLELRFSPAAAPRETWEASLLRRREEARAVLADSPGLRQRLAAAWHDIYDQARKWAARSLQRHDGVDLAVLPRERPWALDQVLDDEWWPAPQPADEPFNPA